MAGSVNKVIIVGNLGRDPESRSFQNGGKVVEMRIATSESWKDKNTGERKERTEWHAIKVMNEALANVAEKYLRKGSKVYVEGQLQTRKWQDKDGNKRSKVLIRADRIHFIPSGKSNLNEVRAESSGASGGDGMAPGNSVGDPPF